MHTFRSGKLPKQQGRGVARGMDKPVLNNMTASIAEICCPKTAKKYEGNTWKPCGRMSCLKFDADLSLSESISDNFLHTYLVLRNG